MGAGVGTGAVRSPACGRVGYDIRCSEGARLGSPGPDFRTGGPPRMSEQTPQAESLHPDFKHFDFQTAFNKVELLLEQRYGIGVSISDVLDPNTGDFDGTHIKIDYDQDLEMALFVLVHLFGHTVQWNISAEFRAIGLETSPGKSDEMLAKIYDYERDATRYSMRLLHDAGVTELDRWVSDWWQADWEFLVHFYRTGEKLDSRKLLVAGKGELLTPLDIPPFELQRWVSRWSF